MSKLSYLDDGVIAPRHLADCEQCGKTGVICDTPQGEVLDRGFKRPVELGYYGVLLMLPPVGNKDGQGEPVPLCSACGRF